MIGIDAGSTLVKWFDGEKFGTGLKEGKNFITGISSKTVFVKKAFYPVCRGSQLRKMIINDVSADIGIEPENITISFCSVRKEKKGCEFLIFIEKKEIIDSLDKNLKDSSVITVDIIGAATAAVLLYREENLTVVDFGATKTAILSMEGGKLREVEIFRAGFPFLKKNRAFLEERIVPRLEGKVVVVGGGALDSEFMNILKGYVQSLEIPQIEVFGKETPLYFNAFGLYHFRKASCKAAFKEFSLFSSEFFVKHRSALITGGAITFVATVLFTVSQFLDFLYEKKNYELTSKEYKKVVEKVLQEKVLAPEIQVSQKLSNFKELRTFLLLDKPSILYSLSGISESVVEGIKILKLEGSAVSESFRISGYADEEKSFKVFTDNLSKYFEKVNTDKVKKVTKGIQFSISVSGVKSGV